MYASVIPCLSAPCWWKCVEKLVRNKVNNANKLCKMSDKYKRFIEKPLLQKGLANWPWHHSTLSLMRWDKHYTPHDALSDWLTLAQIPGRTWGPIIICLLVVWAYPPSYTNMYNYLHRQLSYKLRSSHSLIYYSCFTNFISQTSLSVIALLIQIYEY